MLALIYSQFVLEKNKGSINEATDTDLTPPVF